MIVELAHFCLIVALCVALISVLVPLFSPLGNIPAWNSIARPSAYIQCALLVCAFAGLTYAFVRSDFSVLLVQQNSHTAKPLLYKITGVWGNHEGSLLLWIMVLTLAAALFAALSHKHHSNPIVDHFAARTLAVQSALVVGFLLFSLFTSNPFVRLSDPPLQGQGLNPLLQDPGLALHPPVLYAGYVGLSIAYSMAVAGLLGSVPLLSYQNGRVWAQLLRPWVLMAWILLTLGIALGAWWAYYELGWGGFWFWDPVENASFMPWLLATALLHSINVVVVRKVLHTWTTLLAILAFGFSVLGTFIVRSGVLTSVHAFASDPKRGVFILLLLLVFIGGALGLYAVRAHKVVGGAVVPTLDAEQRTTAHFAVLSRESALIVNNMLLSVACFAVFIGTLWPVFAEVAFAQSVAVGPPFFNITLMPLLVLLMGILPLGAVIAWHQSALLPILRQFWPTAAVCLLIAVVMSVWQKDAVLVVLVLLALWVIVPSTLAMWRRLPAYNHWAQRAAWTGLPRAVLGKHCAHAGIGVLLMGVAFVSLGQSEDMRIADFNAPYRVGDYVVTLQGVNRIQGANYIADQAVIAVQRRGKGGAPVAMLYPERRFYPVSGQITTEAAIDTTLWRDLYVVVRPNRQNQQGQAAPEWVVHMAIKPLAVWLWCGAGLLALGGGLALSAQRPLVME